MRLGFLLPLFFLASLHAQEQKAGDYYRRWVDEDVAWITTEEERAVFLKLSTDEERDRFIEQFWLRRDPDPGTRENEFKEEHYRRILYANENFSAGIEGWKSDRGRVYIKFGPPNSKETYPAGGTYFRRREEGGARTAIFPMERWEYRQIEGIGDDIELEFIDDKGGGLYELTFDKQRKDALLYSGNMGLTQDELEQWQMTGTVSKKDRIFNRREAGEYTGAHAAMSGFERERDKPLAQLEVSAGVNRSLPVKFKDLEAAITTRVIYNPIPVELRTDYVRLTPQQVLVPVTIQIPNKQLTFRREMDIYQAKLRIYGRVSTLARRLETVFEDEIARETGAENLEAMVQRASVYQKRLILKPGVYKLEVGIEDPEGKRMGIAERRLEVPDFSGGELRLSSLILADRIDSEPADAATAAFLLGDLRVLPKMDDAWRRQDSLGLYVQIYNFSVDQQTLKSSIKAEYALAPRDGAAPLEWRDTSAMVRPAGQYCRLARMITLGRLQPGEYEIHLRVHDRISDRSVATRAAFRVSP